MISLASTLFNLREVEGFLNPREQSIGMNYDDFLVVVRSTSELRRLGRGVLNIPGLPTQKTRNSRQSRTRRYAEIC